MLRRLSLLLGPAMFGLFGCGAGWAQELPRARWIENGIIDAGGSHEPYLFVVRRGGQRLDARQSYEAAQSEEVMRKLKEQGVEVFHTHLYKGFGMAAEKPEMEDARRTAAIAHGLGLKVDSYIQWNTLMYETFFAEEPRAKDWVQRDSLGRPILLKYGFQQSYRYRPCFANQEYLDYLKKIVRFAVEEVKTDFIHFDNFDLNAEPDSCQDSTCVRGFREFLKAKYTPAERRERFGFENVDYVSPPQWNAQNRPERMQIIFDPAIQEWIDFRCETMARALGQLARYAKSLNPEVVIEVNPHGITGGNRAWEAGLDHARFLKYTEVFWTEESNLPAYLPDGRLISKIRSYKLARAFNNILFTYTSESPVAMAECLAFNQTLGFAGVHPLRPDMLKYIEFYRKNRELFHGAVEAGEVAVLRSYPSITYNNARAQLSAVLAEQALIQARIPFQLVFDEHLEDLSRFRVLVLPDSECLTDRQLERIRSFVAAGGGLMAIGQSGLYDQWRRLRVRPGLEGLVDGQKPARAYEETVRRAEVAGTAVRKEFQKGRVMYLPGLVFDGPLPEATSYFSITPKFWKLPRNAKEFSDGVRWLAREDLPAAVSGPAYLVSNLVAQPAARRVLVHLVNYGRASAPAVGPVQVRVRLPRGGKVKTVRVYSPDAAPAVVEAVQKGTEAVFSVSGVAVYSIAAVSW